jgi:addiction module HigA family antidote
MARTPIHPGEILADEIDVREGLTKTALARLIDVPPGRISEIIAGKRSITADTALRLGKFLGTEPEFWMNLPKNYELRTARDTIGPELEKIPVHAV